MSSLFIALLSFSSFLARDRTKCLFLNDEPCMVRPTLIDLNLVELKYFKCTGSCNVLSQNTCVPKETKDINVKAFDMITNRNEAKAMTEHVIVNANSIVQYVMQVKNGIIKHVNMNVKIIVRAKKIIVAILTHAFVRIVIT